jgi:hypothetical protein
MKERIKNVLKTSIHLIIIIVCLSFGCTNNTSKPICYETVNTSVYITNVFTAKYSKVQGYIYYRNFKLDIDNGNTGYYYKKYNLTSGDIINGNVTIYQQSYYSNNPYKNDLILSTSEVDFSKYEIK